MDEKIATRDRILQAAIARIRHYGYSKTTMAEIAADCEMSPGNIYRFFESKIDIAEAMARKHYADHHGELSAQARRKDLAVDEKISSVFISRMRDSYKMVEQNAKIIEIAEVLARERPVFTGELMAQERVIIAAMIQEGVDSGLFAPCDTDFVAEILQVATIKFTFPRLLLQQPLARIERELRGVLGLVFHGLYIRPGDDLAHGRGRLDDALASMR